MTELLDSMSWYYKEAGRVSPLTQAEENALSVRIQTGDKRAEHTLIKANLRFVINVARNYEHQGLSSEDLISLGNLGLIRAASTYDGTKGFKFISYAVWWVRQSILNGLAEQSRAMRVPLNRACALHTYSQAVKRLEAKFMRTPTEEELMVELNVSKDCIRDMVNLSTPYVSLDACDQDESPLVALLPSDSRTDSLAEQESLKRALYAVMSILNEREQKIIYLFYGLGGEDGWTLEEIGNKMGLTRERVRQIKEAALRKLGTLSNKKILREHLDWEA